MLKTTHITRDYNDAGSVNSLVALWGFVTDDTFLTKAGHLGLSYQVTGVDFECLGHDERIQIVRRYEAALRGLDANCRVYQYLFKQRLAPFAPAACRNGVVNHVVRERAAALNRRRHNLYEFELYFVLVYEGLRPAVPLHQRLRHKTANATLHADLERAITELHQRAASFESHLADTVAPRRLHKTDAFLLFRRLLNYTPRFLSGPALKYDTHLDYFIADSAIDCHRDHLMVDTSSVKVLTMKEPPSVTYPHVFADLYDLPGEFVACLEWCRIPNDRMRRQLKQQRRHFFNKRVSMVNYVSSDTRPEDMLVDESATATVRQLGEALTEIEVNGHFFGDCSLTVVLFDENKAALTRAVADAIKMMASREGVFVDETYNLLNAWLGVIPGNSAHNLRRLPLLETNCADLSLLFTLNSGAAHSAHLDNEALAVFETRHQTPFHFDLHVEEVGHTLILGATGSGKSHLLNFLALHAQKYEPLTIVFDLGHSYRALAARLHGSYLQLGLDNSALRINPFALAPSPDNLHFLHAFTRVLLEGEDGYRLSDAEDRELYEAVENLYVLDPAQRRLFTLANLLPRALASRLARWIGSGRYADLFDHHEDNFSVHDFQVFDFEAMREYPALLEPLLFYVLHRVAARVNDPASAHVLKICVMDEAWRFIQHDTLRDYVQGALKTWRKHNASMLLATQAADDFKSTALLRTVVESCPTKLLLANPSFDRQLYAELFQLNDVECELMSSLIPRREFLLKRPGLAKVLALNSDI